MRFKIEFPIPSSGFDIVHGQKTILMGSCFSDELAPYFEQAGFECESNSFGTLFHPIAIANVLLASIDKSEEVNIFNRGDLNFSWDAASCVFGNSEKELKEKVQMLRSGFYEKLHSSEYLFITFGTSIGYRHEELDLIVGNCHKAPANKFQKELTELSLMKKIWEFVLQKIFEVNPSLKVIFTVSPVRHVKDGVVENSRSKARLIELAHHLSVKANCYYFPSYEILIDELRDYRFYAKDLVHPSSEAVQYVWERLSDTFFNDKTKSLIDRINKVKMILDHKSLHPASKEDQQRIEKAIRLKEELLRDHSEVYWK